MNNEIAKKFTFPSLIRFTMPTIVMMVFMSLYTMVDGVFVSRLINTSALSAVNIVYPLISLVVAVGIMLATGGSAIVARKLGEGRQDEARRSFTLLVAAGIGFGALFSLAGFLFIDPILRFLGANDAVYAYCYDYTWMLLWFVVPSILQMLFQTFFVTAGKPGYGLGLTAIGGLANIVLDYVFIGPLNMGIAGAALATGIGYCVPGVFGVFYFAFSRKTSLRFMRPKWNGRMLLGACANGSSEMVTNLSTAVVTLLFNVIMMRLVGEDGVAAITIVLYAQYLLTALFLGYSTGVAPVFSYNYGNGDTAQLRWLFKVSMRFLVVGSVAMYALSILLAKDIVRVFAPEGTAVFDLTVSGFYQFAICFLFMGVNIFGSSMFTALSNGKVSAILSFLRTFVFIVIGLVLLPKAFGVDGVWLAIPFGELLGIVVTIWFLYVQRRAYDYAG